MMITNSDKNASTIRGRRKIAKCKKELYTINNYITIKSEQQIFQIHGY